METIPNPQSPIPNLNYSIIIEKIIKKIINFI